MNLLATRVAHAFLVRQGGFVPDKFWRESKAELRKLLLEEIPEHSRRPEHVSHLIYELRGWFNRFHEKLLGFGMHRFAEASLRDRVHGIQKQLEEFSESYEKFIHATSGYAYPITTIEDEIILSLSSRMNSVFETKIKNLRDALKGHWYSDARSVRAVAQRLVKKAPPEVVKALEEEVAAGSGIASDEAIRTKWKWFQSVNLDKLARSLIKVVSRTKLDPLKWIDWLQEVVGSVYAKPEAFTEFELHGVKVVVDDSTVDEMDIKRYVHYLDKAHALLKQKHLDKVWHGTFFIKCKDCGGTNPNDPAGGTGGDYPIGPDVVNIYVRPSDFVVELIAHELGHRYWFKYMNEGQRGKFESLVRVKSDAPIKTDTRQKHDIEKTVADVRAAMSEYLDFMPTTLKKITAGLDQAEKFVPRAGYTATVNDQIAQELQGLERPITTWVSFPGVPNPEGYTHHLFGEKLRSEIQETVKARDALLTHLEETSKIPGTKEWEPDRAPEGLRQLRAWIEKAWKLQAEYLKPMYHFIDAMEKLSQRQIDPNDTRPVPAVSTYGTSNIDEAFAEVFAHYVIGYDMSRDQLESFKSVLKTAADETDPVVEYVAGFFKRHPNLHRYAPEKVIGKDSGGGGSHPEARQAGNTILLFPKFWKLDAKTRDFVFAHELGHYVLSKHGLAKLVEGLQARGVDPWDSDKLPFGQSNMDEAFADSFASYFLGQGELQKRYPEWAAEMRAVLKS